MTFTLPLPPPPPSLRFRDAMHDGHCHSAHRVTSLSLCLQASLFFRLGENINAVAGLADIHTTPKPFNEVHQLRTPRREEGDTSCEGENRKDETVADSP